jgi:hypothetical protein
MPTVDDIFLQLYRMLKSATTAKRYRTPLLIPVPTLPVIQWPFNFVTIVFAAPLSKGLRTRRSPIVHSTFLPLSFMIQGYLTVALALCENGSLYVMRERLSSWSDDVPSHAISELVWRRIGGGCVCFTERSLVFVN